MKSRALSLSQIHPDQQRGSGAHNPDPSPFNPHEPDFPQWTLRGLWFSVVIFPGSGHRGRPPPSNKHTAHLSATKCKHYYVSNLRGFMSTVYVHTSLSPLLVWVSVCTCMSLSTQFSTVRCQFTPSSRNTLHIMHIMHTCLLNLNDFIWGFCKLLTF